MKDFASFDGFPDEARELLQHSGKSEGELTKEIYARAAAGKRAGTLSNEQIDAFYAQFSPMLDPVRRKRLKKLVDELKRM